MPSKWISFDEETNEFKTSFLPSPYIQKRCIKFYEAVKLRKDHKRKWQEYIVSVKGQAGIFTCICVYMYTGCPI